VATSSDRQGWDLAEFHCGRCGTVITATTEREYVSLVRGHKATCPGDGDRAQRAG
jgi:hypothetical protein